MSRYLVYFAVWLALALGFTAVVGRGAFNYYRLRKGGVLTEGIAVARKPHDQIEYSFKADKGVHTRVGIAGIGTPPVEKIALGDKLPVYYLPQAPGISCLGDPGKLFLNELPPVLLAALLFPSAIIAMIAFRHARAGRKSK